MLFCSHSAMKRHLGTLIALAVLAISSCGRREPTPPPAATLSRHLVGDPATLDPTTSTEENGLLVVDLLFRPLLGIDAERKPSPGLAQTWSVSPDGREYCAERRARRCSVSRMTCMIRA